MPTRGLEFTHMLESLLVYFLFSISSYAQAQNEGVKLCDDVWLTTSIKPELEDSEKRFVCGDPNSHFGAWRSVPLSQAQFHLKTFLQNRGYHSSEFESDGKRLRVIVGQPTRIKSIVVEG